MAAPQGFEPRYADPESAVLPLNEGATSKLFLSLCFLVKCYVVSVSYQVAKANCSSTEFSWSRILRFLASFLPLFTL
jgi:hypothetical protein